MVPSLYRERDLQRIWGEKRFDGENLIAEDGRRVVVEFPGVLSGEGGPDFTGARIVLGGVRRAGDVEVHLTPSGWRAHGHARDGAYAGVILHVVLRRDPFQETPTGPPLLVLEPYLGRSWVPEPARPVEDLETLGEEWFADRRSRLLRARERWGPDEALYREILVALGYKHNKAAMAELARRLPVAALPDSAGGIESQFLAEARALPQAMWRLRNVRPANHPWRRLGGMARFLAAARGEGLARGLAERGTPGAMVAWIDPDGTGQIGPDRAREIAYNVFVPFLGEESWRRAAGGPPPPLPGRLYRALGRPVATVREYFGALRLFRRSVSLASAGHGC